MPHIAPCERTLVRSARVNSVRPFALPAFAAATSLAVCAFSVSAQDTGTAPAPEAPETVQTTEATGQDAVLELGAAPATQLSITPYVWLTSLTGESGARGQLVDVDQSFGDVVENADSLLGFMGAVELQHGAWIFNLNSAYTRAEFGRERTRFVTGPGGGSGTVDVDVETEVESLVLELFAGRRFFEEAVGESGDGRVAVDGFAGVRWTDLDLGIQANALADAVLADGTPVQAGVARDVGGDASWFEPFVGGRVEYRPNERWTFSLRGDIGGFDIDGSAFAWQTIAIAGYTWQADGWTLTLAGGYRALGQDYEEDGVTWDVVTHGPILGLSAGFAF